MGAALCLANCKKSSTPLSYSSLMCGLVIQLRSILVALLRSLLNGKLFMEWICPAVAQAYHCHISAHATTYREESDIYNDNIVREITVEGVAWNIIQKPPVQQFNSSKMFKLYNDSCCSICFQDFEDEEFVRTLPKCGHFFHLVCIDKWLVQQGSCPMCKIYVPDL
ncbi:NEP1-interacting protein-like 2 [Glycine max]|uniref:NEP1-interacting protein-like 2 n=1 Tax=Glycine max TaxID=3847 RepID=UPI0007193534|nr:NEP1-interacting protein-like 2 [Glycine max]|eukprot:XP_014630609.1 NEP1-interacting protein-like 2 [Glycine max]